MKEAAAANIGSSAVLAVRLMRGNRSHPERG